MVLNLDLAPPVLERNLATDAGAASKKAELQGELRRLGGGVRKLRGPREYKRRTGERHHPHSERFSDQ